MAEWSKAAVSKTVNGLARSGVQIPFSPPDFFFFVRNPCFNWDYLVLFVYVNLYV